MAWEFVAQGNVIELANLGQYEGQLPEGCFNRLELDLRLPVSDWVAQNLEEQLRAAGIPDVTVTTASPLLRIYFTKGFPWLAVIAAAVLGLIALSILIVAWRLYTDVSGDVPPPIPQIALIVLLVLGAVLVVSVVRRKTT